VRRLDAAFTGCILALAMGALWWSLEWPFRSRMFVQVVSIPLIALAVAQLAFGIRSLRREVTGAEKRGMDLQLGGDLPPEVVARRGLAFSGWVVGFFLALWLLGYIVGSLVMVVLYMAIAMRERFMPIAGMVLSLSLVVYLMRAILHIPLPRSALLRMFGG
jgi:hypothetical protein